jgi:hypothetical protein
MLREFLQQNVYATKNVVFMVNSVMIYVGKKLQTENVFLTIVIIVGHVLRRQVNVLVIIVLWGIIVSPQCVILLLAEDGPLVVMGVQGGFVELV